jgi:protein-S-isoprenylcysteine O-methyltransferase Ste14
MAVAALIALLILWRTAQEDRFLQDQLSGYAAYAARTHFRLVPGLW